MESLKRFWIDLKSPPYVNFFCRYYGFHSSVVKNSILLKFNAMSLYRCIGGLCCSEETTHLHFQQFKVHEL